MSQLAENQKEVSSMINKQEELRISNATYNEQIDIMKAHQNELMKELKQMAINAEDVKIQGMYMNSHIPFMYIRIDLMMIVGYISIYIHRCIILSNNHLCNIS